ncbi:hypothetical protein PUN28_019694 [Cardiocondyla obscurior]|uniref:Uncharacterized protein n=1 Tax=Cardiocondyla obscurior TaxID=286306 RepID=A0AAW2EBD6_9HYME
MKQLIAILKDKCPNTTNNENEVAVDYLSLLPDFPLSLICDQKYLEFNSRLKNDEVILEGDTNQKIVSNILSYTMTYELGHKMSWTGAKKLIAVENSLFINTVIA